MSESMAKDVDDPAKASTPELEDRIVELNLEVRGLKNQAKERGQLLKMFVEELAVRRAEDGQPKLFDKPAGASAEVVKEMVSVIGEGNVMSIKVTKTPSWKRESYALDCATPIGELDLPDPLSAKLRRHGLDTVGNVLAAAGGDLSLSSLIEHDNDGGDQDRIGPKEISALRKALRAAPAAVA